MLISPTILPNLRAGRIPPLRDSQAGRLFAPNQAVCPCKGDPAAPLVTSIRVKAESPPTDHKPTMNVDRFLRHHGLIENPFAAEEARHDRVFERLADDAHAHPDFEKVLGRIDRPATAVVFGEKGSGKTAIRLMIDRRVAEHNDAHPDDRTLLITYDDLNPMLDRILQAKRDRLGFRKSAKAKPEKLLEAVRLENHQDAILSLGVTQIVDELLDESNRQQTREQVKKMTHARRVDLAQLAALYDDSPGEPVASRWRRLRTKLKTGWRIPMLWWRHVASAVGIVALVLVCVHWAMSDPPGWMLPSTLVSVCAAIGLWAYWSVRQYKAWDLTRRVLDDMPGSRRTSNDLRLMLLDLPPRDLVPRPWPREDDHDSRYQLTTKLLNAIKDMGYASAMVLVDRVDEPAAVTGKPERMRPIIWPMLDNKFLQQEKFGLKLLLPLELNHLLHRESSDFFQEARLDKQNLVDRLTWSGTTLYDLCNTRLKACLGSAIASRSRLSAVTPANDPTPAHTEIESPPTMGDDVELGDASPEDATRQFDEWSTPDDESAAIEVEQPVTTELEPPVESPAAPQPAPARVALEPPEPPEPAGQSASTVLDLFTDDVNRQLMVDALDQMQQPRDAFKFLYMVIQEHCRNTTDDDDAYHIPKLTLETIRRQQAQRVQDLQRGVAPA